MAETIHVRGEGGQIIEMGLPLPEPIADRLTKGLLRQVNADGSPHSGAAVEWTDLAGQERGSALTEGRTPRPDKTARKAEWVGWAVGVHGLDPEKADGMTKGDLMELPEHPAPAAAGGQGRPGRPSEDADKSEWISYAVSQGLVSAEDAANYTKDDLIEMTE